MFVKEVQHAVLDGPRRRRRALGEGPSERDHGGPGDRCLLCPSRPGRRARRGDPRPARARGDRGERLGASAGPARLGAARPDVRRAARQHRPAPGTGARGWSGRDGGGRAGGARAHPPRRRAARSADGSCPPPVRAASRSECRCRRPRHARALWPRSTTPSTRHAVTLERAFLAELGSGCSLPVGAHSDGERFHAFLAADDVVSPASRRACSRRCSSCRVTGPTWSSCGRWPPPPGTRSAHRDGRRPRRPPSGGDAAGARLARDRTGRRRGRGRARAADLHRARRSTAGARSRRHWPTSTRSTGWSSRRPTAPAPSAPRPATARRVRLAAVGPATADGARRPRPARRSTSCRGASASTGCWPSSRPVVATC